MRRRPLTLVTSELEPTRVLRAVEKGSSPTFPFQGLSSTTGAALGAGSAPLTGDGSRGAQNPELPGAVPTCTNGWARSSQKKRTSGSTVSCGNTSPNKCLQSTRNPDSPVRCCQKQHQEGTTTSLKNICETFPLSLLSGVAGLNRAVGLSATHKRYPGQMDKEQNFQGGFFLKKQHPAAKLPSALSLPPSCVPDFYVFLKEF